MTLSIDDLNHPDFYVRINAAWELAESASLRLIGALRHSDTQVRWRAAAALGFAHQTDAVRPLGDILLGADYELGWNAAWALGEIGDRRAVPALLAALYAPPDFSPDVRYVAALGLVRLGERDALRAALQTDHEDASRAAHAALAASRYF